MNSMSENRHKIVTAGTIREARLGAIIGAVLLMAAITVINTAILLKGGDTASLVIPNLCLAVGVAVGTFLVVPNGMLCGVRGRTKFRPTRLLFDCIRGIWLDWCPPQDRSQDRG